MSILLTVAATSTAKGYHGVRHRFNGFNGPVLTVSNGFNGPALTVSNGFNGVALTVSNGFNGPALTVSNGFNGVAASIANGFDGRSLLAYESSEGRLKLIDGHVRRDNDPDMEVEVKVLDATRARRDFIPQFSVRNRRRFFSRNLLSLLIVFQPSGCNLIQNNRQLELREVNPRKVNRPSIGSIGLNSIHRFWGKRRFFGKEGCQTEFCYVNM